MSYTRLIAVSGTFILLLSASGLSRAEETHAGTPTATETATAPADSHPAAETQIKPEIVSALVKLFPIFTDSAIRDRYGVSLPAALTNLARDKKEDAIADFVAELFGTLNDAQVAKLVDGADRELRAEKEKPRERQSQDLIRLLERLKEAALDVQKKPGDPALSDFRKAFEAKFDVVKKKNKEFYTLLKQAATNDAARRQLLEKYGDPQHPELFWRFLRDQCATGNDKLCVDMSSNLTFKDPQTGDHFFDVVNATNNHKQRVVLGSKDSDFKNALQDISDQTNGFSGLRFSPTQHETLDDQPLRLRANRPTPPARTPAPRPGPTLTQDPAPIRRRSPGTGPGPTPSPSPSPSQAPPGGTDPAAALRAKTAEVASLISDHCLGCHSGPHPRGGLAFNSDGTISGGRDTIEAVLRRTLVDRDMPKGGHLNDAEMSTLRQWAQLQNITVQ